MIPYVFAVIGGYLIGQSTKSKMLDNAANGTIPDAGLEVAATSVLAKGGKLIPRYVVSVYKDGEYEIYEAESYAEAKRLATQGEHAEIYDTKLKKDIE